MLGKKVRDIITGFSGTVTGRVEYITGCNQLLIVPPIGEKGELPESHWFDESRCEVVDARPIKLKKTAVTSVGFDKPAPIR